MRKVAVVTDSSANLPSALAEQWDIRIVPTVLAYKGQTFRDGVDVTPGELYRWLRTNKHVPTTAAPSIGDFLRVYAALSQDDVDVVSIHPSPSLTATYAVAVAASQLVDGASIRVVNCNVVAMAQGFVALEAARAAARGDDLEAVLDRVAGVASQVRLIAAIDTLEYLYRGGRIGAAAALMGMALQVKPILYVDEGHVQVFARPRTMGKAIRMMLEHLAEQADGRQLHAAIQHADAPEEADDLRRRVAAQFRCAELFVSEFTPVMGAHTGPGLIGVAFFADGDGHPIPQAITDEPEALAAA